MHDLQRRMLEHTAGVLQVTHTGFLKNETPPQTPDGLSRFMVGRNSAASNENFYDFDDRSFYLALDSLLETDDSADRGDVLTKHSFAAQNRVISETERRLESLISRLQGSTAQANAGRAPISKDPISGYGERDVPEPTIHLQLDQLDKGLEEIQRDRDAAIDEAQHLTTKSGIDKEKAGQYEAALMGLWEMLISAHNQTRGGESQRDSSGSEGSKESSKSDESFSLEGFQDKVRTLRSRHANLQEQKDILTRQIQQQRELNGKSDAQKDSQIAGLTTELEQTQVALEAKQRDEKEVRDELVLVTQHLDNARQEATLQEQQRENNTRSILEAERHARKEAEEQLLADLEAKQDELHRLKAELADTKDDHGIAKAAMRAELEESEKRVQQSIGQVEAAQEAKAHQDALELSLKQQIEAKTQEAEKAHDEIEGLEGRWSVCTPS